LPNIPEAFSLDVKIGQALCEARWKWLGRSNVRCGVGVNPGSRIKTTPFFRGGLIKTRGQANDGPVVSEFMEEKHVRVTRLAPVAIHKFFASCRSHVDAGNASSIR